MTKSQFDNADEIDSTTGDHEIKRKRPRAAWGIVIILVVLGVALYAYSGGMFRGGAKWQTVFLTNNQAYFGRLISHGDTYVLSDVFYLRTNTNFQPTTPSATAFDIVKLGGELHGPESVMYIPKTSILFWENMRSDSQVVTAIENFLKTSK